jgi:hypothetical protein
MMDATSIASSMTAIVLRPGVKERDFEKFMREEVFPTINLATRLFETREHVLLRSDQKIDGRSQYLWTVFATTTNKLQGDSQLRDLLTESSARADLSARIKPHGTFLTFTRPPNPIPVVSGKSRSVDSPASRPSPRKRR